eukprot:bmy_02474T0
MKKNFEEIVFNTSNDLRPTNKTDKIKVLKKRKCVHHSKGLIVFLRNCSIIRPLPNPRKKKDCEREDAWVLLGRLNISKPPDLLQVYSVTNWEKSCVRGRKWAELSCKSLNRSDKGKVRIVTFQYQIKLIPLFFERTYQILSLRKEGMLSSPLSKNTVHFDNRIGNCLLLSTTHYFLLVNRIPQPQPTERNQFLYTIFNLIERPGDEQSQVILMNYVAFAHDVGPTRSQTTTVMERD